MTSHGQETGLRAIGRRKKKRKKNKREEEVSMPYIQLMIWILRKNYN